MAQAVETASTLLAVAVASPASMKLAGSAPGFSNSPDARSAQASVPPGIVPAMSTGAPMAMAAPEPSTPSSSV